MIPSEPKHYSIILVHGTWARGMFPAPASPISDPAHSDEIDHRPASRWFDRGSPFRNQLVETLNRKVLVYSYDIRSFEWSGTNSFMARWRAATDLAADIKKIATENLESRIVCIAHSHGGNVVLHAIEQLQGIDLSDASNKKIDVITLATPFVSVYPVLYSPRTGVHTEARQVYYDKWRLLSVSSHCAAMTFLGTAFWYLASSDLSSLLASIVSNTVYVLGLVFLIPAIMGFYAIFLTGSVFNARTPADWPGFWSGFLADKPAVSYLALRSVDDEAGFALVLGRLGAKLDAVLERWITQSLPSKGVTLGLYCAAAFTVSKLDATLSATYTICTAIICFVFPLLAALLRGSAGRELIFAGAGYSVAINSFPDTVREFPATSQEIGAVTIESYGGRLRHALYLDRCMDIIVRWLDRDRARAFAVMDRGRRHTWLESHKAK
jgi:hypothetical protein